MEEMVRKLKQMKELVAFYRRSLKDAMASARADVTDPEMKAHEE